MKLPHLAAPYALATMCIAWQPSVAQSGPAEILALRQAVIDHAWDRATTFLDTRRADARRDITLDGRYLFAYRAFDTADPTLGAHLDAWVAAQPTNSIARAARAEYRLARGWRVRRFGSANTVTDAMNEAMRTFLELATEDAKVIAILDPADITPYWIMLDVTRLIGDHETQRSVIDDAARVAPGSLALHMRHMESLRPRWGGSADAMREYADSMQRFVALNPGLKALKGFAAYDRWETLMEDHQNEAALLACNEALSFGDNPVFRYARAQLLFDMDEPEKALVDVNRAIAERPGWSRQLAYRSMILATIAYHSRDPGVKAELLRRAREDIRIAGALDPTDPDVIWARKYFDKSTP